MRIRGSALLILGALSLTALAGFHVFARQTSDPDLIIDRPLMQAEWAVGWRFVPPGDCTIAEGCVLAPGMRKILTFSVQTANISQTELVLGDPTTSPYFEYSPCHGHYHLLEFSDYRITTPGGGGTLVTSRKQDWCLLDWVQYLFEPWVAPTGVHDCDNQGMLGGWSDIYVIGMQCQGLDVTDLPPGDYDLTAIVNSGERIPESDYSNNSSTIPVQVPDLVGDPDLVLDAGRIAASLKYEQRTFPINHSAIADVCLGGYTARRLITFDTMAGNISQSDFYLSDPAYSSLITWSPTHLHNHVQDLVKYQLFDLQGNPVTPARGAISWLPGDKAPYLTEPWINPGPFYAPQGESGIQRGWYALNAQPRDCSWVDVTLVPDGKYRLRATINPSGLYRESNLANNVVEVDVTLTGTSLGIVHRPDGTFVPGAPLDVLPAPGGAHIIYDVSPASCPAPNYNVYYGDTPPGSYTYTGAACNVGTTGDTFIPLPDPPPGGLLWFTIVGRDGGSDGGHGFDSAGQARPLTGAGRCGVARTLPRLSCGPP